jgi:hypothetical protein
VVTKNTTEDEGDQIKLIVNLEFMRETNDSPQRTSGKETAEG